LRKLLRLTDNNKDGVISLEEFFGMINKPPEAFFENESDINTHQEYMTDKGSEMPEERSEMNEAIEVEEEEESKQNPFSS